MIWSSVYPEPADEVIAGEQVIDQELEGMASGGLVERKNIERPLIHFLKNKQEYSGQQYRDVITLIITKILH